MMIKKILKVFLILVMIGIVGLLSYIWSIFVWLMAYGISAIIRVMLCIIFPLLFVPLLFKEKRKLVFLIVIAYVVVTLLALGINIAVNKYDESITIKTDVNINVLEYMPFEEKTKIAKLGRESSLKLSENLPILDGAAAVFPVYSSFINAVYPDDVKYQEAPFYYNNTSLGYQQLAQKETDIFFGAYPSAEQIEYASDNNTEFEYTPIGKEGFVFFVNKDNPVNNLTTEQVKGIYSGKITNWKEVGGKDEKIVAFQRNEGSGSQSMLKRFMQGTKLMDPPKEHVIDTMSGITDVVSNYRNYSNSIGFSFRYYMEGIIKNPDIKLISIDGVAPTKDNISSDSYPITTNLYAVTYKGNSNPNVKLLIDWILSDEGQEIIENTGYARIK